ncbi:MAG: bacterial transcriptional activator domain-containing protein [Sulfitobacter sp.]
MSRIEINLIGGLSASVGDAPAHPLKLSPTGLSLFGLLAMGAGKRALRCEAVTETLWPECAPAKQRARLRTALWRLKKGLPDWAQGMVCREGDTSGLSLPDNVHLVHEGFERCVVRLCAISVDVMTDEDFTALDVCLRRYGGPLLDGVQGDWIMADREKFAEIYCQGLAHQINYLRTHGRDHETIRAGRRLLQVDPYREDVHATLIETYAGSGRPERAKRQFQTCEDLFQGELGISPVVARLSLSKTQGAGEVPREDIVQMVEDLQGSVAAMVVQLERIQAVLGDGRGGVQPVKRDVSMSA